MRELTIADLNWVGGGDYSAGDMIAIGTALGGGIGASLAGQFGLGVADSLLLAGIGSALLGGGTAAAIAGWAIGQGINNHTPIQEWLAKRLDSFNATNNATLDGDE